MDILNSLFPTELFAQIIVIIQLILFGFWLLFLVRKSRYVSITRSEIERLHDVDELVGEVELSALSLKNDASKTFQRFAQSRRSSKNSFVYRHLETIFLAGITRSELNIQALLKSSSARIAAVIQPMRAVLSLFIVLGLLGTLFGLSTSLGKLSTIPEGSLTSGNSLSTGYFEMLKQLSGAFTPSILGVALTIIGVAIFAFLQRRASGLVFQLEEETLMTWARRLIPSTPDHLFKQLQRSEKQLQENLEAAQEVAEFAHDIRNDAEGLKTEINETRLKFKELRDASENLVVFSQNFSNSMLNLPEFQTELRDLNRQMLADSEALHIVLGQSVSSMNSGVDSALSMMEERLTGILGPIRSDVDHSINESRSLLSEIRQVLVDMNERFEAQTSHFQSERDEQRLQLHDVLQTLKTYESSYIESRQAIDQTLLKNLEAAEKANLTMGQHNDALITGIDKALGVPLRDELAKSLEGIPSSLKGISTSLGQTNIPLDQAAERMSHITGMFKDTAETLTKDIRAEFNTRNKTNDKAAEDLKGIKTSIDTLNQRIKDLTTSLKGSSKQSAKIKPTTVENGDAPFLPAKKVRFASTRALYNRLPWRRK